MGRDDERKMLQGNYGTRTKKCDTKSGITIEVIPGTVPIHFLVEERNNLINVPKEMRKVESGKRSRKEKVDRQVIERMVGK